MATFKKADRTKKKLRLALDGPAGSGKTLTALRFAMQLAKFEASKSNPPRAPRIAVIDTENGSASIYQGDIYDDAPIDFDVVELSEFSPTKYSEMVRMAAFEKFDVLVIDSLSHAWSGKGGALEIVDKKTQQDKNSNSFSSWKDVTPLQNEMLETIIRAPLHVIVTMRTKTEWVLETNERGRMVPRKIGMAPVQRQGVEYEFDIVLDIDQDHTAHVTKSRCSAIADRCSTTPGREFIAPVIHWLNQGGEIPEELMEAARLEMANGGHRAAAAGLPAAGAAKEETTAERLARLKAEKEAMNAAAAASAPAVAPTKTNGAAKLSIKPLQETPAPAPATPAPAPATPAATPATLTLAPEPQNSVNPADYVPLADNEIPTASGPVAPFRLDTLTDQEKGTPATARQGAVILAMYAALGLSHEAVETACARRSPSGGKTVADVVAAGAVNMQLAARAKMMEIKGDWSYWTEQINAELAKEKKSQEEIPF